MPDVAGPAEVAAAVAAEAAAAAAGATRASNGSTKRLSKKKATAQPTQPEGDGPEAAPKAVSSDEARERVEQV